MAYLNIDLLAPIQGAFLTNTKVKNLVLNSSYKWPTTWVNGIEVFDDLNLWNGSSFVGSKLATKVIGIKPSDITNTKDVGEVERIWLYLKPVSNIVSRNPLTSAEVENYLNANSVLDEEVEVSLTYTQRVASQNIRAADVPTDQQLIDMVEGGYGSVYPVGFVENEATGNTLNYDVFGRLVGYNTEVSPVTFAALMDTENLLFESTTKIKSKSIETAYSTTWNGQRVPSSYTLAVDFSYKFKRVKSAEDVTVQPLTDLMLSKTNDMSLVFEAISFYKQIGRMIKFYNPIVDDGVLYYNYTDPEEAAIYHDSAVTKTYIRVDGVRAMKAKQFNAFFAQAVDSDYKVKSQGDGGFLSFLIIIVVVVIAIYSGGAALSSAIKAGTVGAGSVGAAAVFMTAFSFAITIGMVVVATLGQSIGGSLGYAFRNSVVTLSKIAEVAGIIATVLTVVNYAQMAREAIGKQLMTDAQKQAAYDQLSNEAMDGITEEALNEAMKAAAVEAYSNASMGQILSTVGDMIVDAVVGQVSSASDVVVNAFSGSMFSDMSTTEILSSIVKGLNMAMEVYKKVYPIQDPGTPQTTASNEIPDKIENTDIFFKEFESTSIYDPITTEDMCYALGQGTIANKYSKYFNNSV